jgi:hypothetical protein
MTRGRMGSNCFQTAISESLLEAQVGLGYKIYKPTPSLFAHYSARSESDLLLLRGGQIYFLSAADSK